MHRKKLVPRGSCPTAIRQCTRVLKEPSCMMGVNSKGVGGYFSPSGSKSTRGAPKQYCLGTNVSDTGLRLWVCIGQSRESTMPCTKPQPSSGGGSGSLSLGAIVVRRQLSPDENRCCSGLPQWLTRFSRTHPNSCSGHNIGSGYNSCYVTTC